MVDKIYLNNLPSQNILHGSQINNNIVTSNFNNNSNNDFSNLVLNSNLENSNIIK